MLLYYLRHGDPIYNPDQLTEKGHTQAEALSKRLVGSRIDKIYASSSNRARQTAAPLAEKTGLPVEILDWCSEDYAYREFTVTENGCKRWIYQSEPYLKLFASEEITRMGYEWYDHPAFAETGCKQGMKRVAEFADAFLAELGYEHDSANRCYRAVAPNDKHIALFAHEGFSKVFLSHVLDIPYPILARFEYEHTGMTVIDFQVYSDRLCFAKVLQYSGDSHFYKEGLSLAYNNVIEI